MMSPVVARLLVAINETEEQWLGVPHCRNNSRHLIFRIGITAFFGKITIRESRFCKVELTPFLSPIAVITRTVCIDRKPGTHQERVDHAASPSEPPPLRSSSICRLPCHQPLLELFPHRISSYPSIFSSPEHGCNKVDGSQTGLHSLGSIRVLCQFSDI